MNVQGRVTLRVSGWAVMMATVVCLGLRSEAQLPQMDSFNTNAKAFEGKVPDYDVVSIKVHKPAEGMMRMMMRPDGFQMDNVTAKNLVANAYGLRSDLVSGGPGWMSSTGYDIQAKVAGADVEQYRKLNAAQRRIMLQAALAERFQLKVHKETKEAQIYELVVAKGGIKAESVPAPPPPSPPPASPEGGASASAAPAGKPMRIMMGPDRLEADSATTTQLAAQLSGSLQATVVDKTGLTGYYNFKLHWTPENAPPHADNGGDSAPSIFTAVQEQTGLKLQPVKGPVETVIIDHAELPTEN